MQQQVRDWQDDTHAAEVPAARHDPAHPQLSPVPDAQMASPPQPRSLRSGTVPASVGGGVGFLVGAIFWHFIGFWGFVSEVVFSHRQGVEDRQIAQTGAHCLQLILDRSTGTVRGEPCALEAPQLDESASTAKSDFLANRRQLAHGRRASRAIRVTAGDR